MNGIWSLVLAVAVGVSVEDQAKVMGDYEGVILREGSGPSPVSAQVIALGGGTYRARLLPALDPGDKSAMPALPILEGTTAEDGRVAFTGTGGSGVIRDGRFQGKVGEKVAFDMKRIVRHSPTEGKQPPKGAVVLLGPAVGNLDAWRSAKNENPAPWKLLPGGVMQCKPGSGSVITKQEFGSATIHIEFRCPFEPDKRGQGRGNSGVYVQGRYEVQVLDSYGLEGKDNECGGIYKVAAPRVNMAYPPLQWQTYDITFHAPRMEGGEVKEPARMSVLHNGVSVHENVVLHAPTGAARFQGAAATGGIYLQDHGNVVEYRNAWVVPM